MIGKLLTLIIIKPIFNLLVIIYALLPGHNFGLAIIIFTTLVRLLMWPLVKKQLHQAKAMRELQPELKRIKKAAGGDRQKESAMMLELYKEREINPFSSIGLLIVQIPIFIGLYSGLHRIVKNPHELVTYSYSWVSHMSWIKAIAADIHKFDLTLVKVVDLSKPALSGGKIYIPAMIIVLASVVIQYLQAQQLMPTSGKKRSLRSILSEANTGKQTDQSEINEAVGQSTKYMLPLFILFVTINIASALSLYWLTSGVVAYLQQAKILGRDTNEMEAAASATVTSGKGGSRTIEAEIIPPKNSSKNKKSGKKKGGKTKRNRR